MLVDICAFLSYNNGTLKNCRILSREPKRSNRVLAYVWTFCLVSDTSFLIITHMDKDIFIIIHKLKQVGLDPDKLKKYWLDYDFNQIFRNPQSTEEGVVISATLGMSKEEAVEVCKNYQMKEWGLSEDECFQEDDFVDAYVTKPKDGEPNPEDWEWIVSSVKPEGYSYQVWWARA